MKPNPPELLTRAVVLGGVLGGAVRTGAGAGSGFRSGGVVGLFGSVAELGRLPFGFCGFVADEFGFVVVGLL
ncbi:hypothetical protein GCM10028804_13170 [Larkinella terrae]